MITVRRFWETYQLFFIALSRQNRFYLGEKTCTPLKDAEHHCLVSPESPIEGNAGTEMEIGDDIFDQR